MRDMPLCALFFAHFAQEQTREACIYRTQRLNPIGSQPRCARGSCCLGRRQRVLAATAAPLATLHSVALMHMGRKPYTEAGKERRRNRTTEALLPPHLLHGDDDCNQQAGEAVLDGASAAAAALPAADCAACCDGAAHGEAAQFFSPGAELASHLVRHNWCVTTRRSTRFMLHVYSPSLICGLAVRSPLCTAAQCLRTRWIRRTHSPFTAPSVMGALCLAACVVKGRKPTRRISARFRRLGRFPVAAATRAHTPAPLPQQALRTSMRSVGYSILAFVPCCAMWDRC